MNKTINELDELDISANDDEFAIFEKSTSKTKKIKKGDLCNNSYSTTETKTGGKWVDGKPIYRRCLQLSQETSVSTSYASITDWTDVLAGMNIEALISADTTICATNTTNVSSVVYVRKSDFYIRNSLGTATYPQGATLIVEYTKTTV